MATREGPIGKEIRGVLDVAEGGLMVTNSNRRMERSVKKRFFHSGSLRV